MIVYLLIGVVLLCKSASTILMRILNKLSDMTVVTWQAFTLGLFSITWVYASGNDFSIVNEFDQVDFALLGIMATSIVFHQKYEAFQAQHLTSAAI